MLSSANLCVLIEQDSLYRLPRYPIAADTFTTDTLHLMMERLKAHNEFVLVDSFPRFFR